jgi:hypothetical protein
MTMELRRWLSGKLPTIMGGRGEAGRGARGRGGSAHGREGLGDGPAVAFRVACHVGAVAVLVDALVDDGTRSPGRRLP